MGPNLERKNKMATLTEQAEKILEIAEAAGVQSNFFFKTTFRRYQVQLNNLTALEKAINEYGTTIKKVYVKGRENLYVNPAIGEYNKTAEAANRTVSTLIKIIRTFNVGDENDEIEDPLLKIINGGDDDDNDDSDSDDE
jgi:hypothetical protein